MRKGTEIRFGMVRPRAPRPPAPATSTDGLARSFDPSRGTSEHAIGARPILTTDHTDNTDGLARRAIDGQVGAMFLVNGRPGGIELFDAPATWKKLSPKLVRRRVHGGTVGRRVSGSRLADYAATRS